MTEGVTALSKKELDRFPIIRVVVGKELLQRKIFSSVRRRSGRA